LTQIKRKNRISAKSGLNSNLTSRVLMKDFQDKRQTTPPLIGVRFNKGVQIDQILDAVADRLKERKLCVAGVVQVRGSASGECDCRQMCLRDLATGKSNPITEDRGPLAQGCHLDRTALMRLAQSLESKLTVETDILILNRFGQAESEGRGFRGAVERAMTLNIPVIIAYRDEFQVEWSEFEGGLARSADPVVDEIVEMVSVGRFSN
jgi:hypothetical protein